MVDFEMARLNLSVVIIDGIIVGVGVLDPWLLSRRR